jgi:hypothetical protein
MVDMTFYSIKEWLIECGFMKSPSQMKQDTIVLDNASCGFMKEIVATTHYRRTKELKDNNCGLLACNSIYSGQHIKSEHGNIFRDAETTMGLTSALCRVRACNCAHQGDTNFTSYRLP